MKKTEKTPIKKDIDLPTEWQDVDKGPEKEKEDGDKVTTNDLKGKKVDEDPEQESDKPLDIKTEE